MKKTVEEIHKGLKENFESPNKFFGYLGEVLHAEISTTAVLNWILSYFISHSATSGKINEFFVFLESWIEFQIKNKWW